MLHKGYEVWIADSRKQPLPEYGVEIGDDRSVITCYIPSDSGKQFSIRWKDHNGPMGHHTSMKTSVDGVHAGKTHCHPGAADKRVGLRTDSALVYRPFQFAALQTTDEDDALWAAGGTPDELGTIELRVVHVHPTVRKATFRPSTFAGVSRVHERSKKAGTHCVSLGEARPEGKATSTTRIRTTPLDTHAPPFATFRFRYRPAAILQAEGIMPAAGEPIPLRARARLSDRHGKGKGKGTARESDARARATSAAERKPLKSELQRDDEAAGIRGQGSGNIIVIELSDDEEVPQRKPVIKRDPDARRGYDPHDVIDLTSD